MAIDSGLAAALCLPPVVFSGSVQDTEARARGPQVRLGQAGAHCRREVRAVGESGFRQRAVAAVWTRCLQVSGTAVARTPPDFYATPSMSVCPASRSRLPSRPWI